MCGLRIRLARPADAMAVHSLVARAGTLELNSAYAYLLLCDHFADTCVVAEQEGVIVGAVLGYRPPSRSDAIFVWQVGVDRSARGQGLGVRLLSAFVRSAGGASATFLEATVAASNTASRALFSAFARAEGASLEVLGGYAPPLLPTDHPAEPLLRIGPLSRKAVVGSPRKTAAPADIPSTPNAAHPPEPQGASDE